MNLQYYYLAIISTFLFCSNLSAQHTVINEADAVAIGKRLEMQAAGGDAAALFRIIDSASFYSKIVAASPMAKDPAFMEGFHKGFSLLKMGGPVQEAINKGSFRFVRTYEKNGDRHLLFRLSPGIGYNYYDYTLIKIGENIRASDIFFYINDEALSTSLINLISTMTDMEPGIEEINSIRSSFQELSTLKKKGDWAGMKAVYEKLDEPLRHNKTLSLINLTACQHIDIATYKQALDQYAQDFPQATNVLLMKIDMFALNGEYQHAIEAIDNLDSLARDPALDYLRAIQYTNLKQMDSALHCYERVFTYDPSLPNNTKKLIAQYMSNGSKDKAVNALAQYQKTAYAKKELIDNLYTDFPGLK